MNTIRNEALYDGTNQIIIDVRSPGEFEEYHIETAINIPLFNNEERHEIGLAYKTKSVKKAKLLGMQYMSAKLEAISESLIEYAEQYDRVILYCQRGGMRSQSICALMNAVDVQNLYRLEEGIKGHRQYTIDTMKSLLDEKRFIVLHGHTGVGKTKILVRQKELGIETIDYEGLAQNAGSVFGNIMYAKTPPTQKQFEEQLFHILAYSKEKYLFIESEGKRVGGLLIPDMFMDKLEEGIHILVETTLENRVANLLSDYHMRDDEALKVCINKLRKRLSNNVADELIEHINNGNLNALVKYLLLDYYDPLYNYSIGKYEYAYRVNYETVEGAVQEIIAAYQKGI